MSSKTFWIIAIGLSLLALPADSEPPALIHAFVRGIGAAMVASVVAPLIDRDGD